MSSEERRHLLQQFKEREKMRRKSFYKGSYRYFLFGLALLQTFCASGVVLGWVPLAYLLQNRDIYNENCPIQSQSQNNYHALDAPSPICPDQQSRLALVYTLGLMGMYASRAPCGWFMDTFGTKRTTVVGSLFLGLGAVLFILALDQGPIPPLPFPLLALLHTLPHQPLILNNDNKTTGGCSLGCTSGVDLYPYAFGLIGLGSGAIHLPCLQFANLFPGSERTAVLYPLL